MAEREENGSERFSLDDIIQGSNEGTQEQQGEQQQQEQQGDGKGQRQSADDAISKHIDEAESRITPDPLKKKDGQQGEQREPQQDTAGGRAQRVDQQGRPIDLIDRHGNVVARGGAERRTYEKNALSRALELEGAARAQRQEIETLKRQVAGFSQANEALGQYGLSPPDLLMAAQLLHGIKTEPVKVVKDLLAALQAKGVQIDGIGGGVDVQAIVKAVRAEMAPLRESARHSAEIARIQSESAQETNEFLARYPDAAMHEDEIARILGERPDVTLDGAYWMLKHGFAAHGLDWNRPLKDQTAALRKPNGSGAGSDFPPQGRTRLPGSPAVKPVSSTESWDNIIAGALKDASA